MSTRPFITRQRLLLALWSAFLFAFCVALEVRHDHFPYCYHPDEPSKVDQIITGKWNFHHPMLLLRVSKAAVDLLHTPADAQAIVQVGRRVSACFMAGAIVAFSLLAFLWRGWTAAFIAGAALALHHQPYELAHYMKEDSGLLLGLAFAFTSAVAYAQRGSSLRVIAVGISCALAISGKYIGVISLAVALPAVWAGSAPEVRGRRLALMLGALAVTLCLINLPLLLDLGTFQESFSREIKLVVHAPGETSRHVPHAVYWKVFIDNSNPVMWLLLVAFFATWKHRRRHRTLAQRLVVAFPFVYSLILSFSAKDNDRYFLPATAVFVFLAALGAEDAPTVCAEVGGFLGVQHPERLLAQPGRRWIILGAALLLCLVEFAGWASTRVGLAQYDSAFVHDDIADLVSWMKREIPPNAIVVADERARLPDSGRKKQAAVRETFPQKIWSDRKLAADYGSLAELRAKGVGYVIISESSYGQFFRGDRRLKADASAPANPARAFYEQLLRGGNLLFERERGTVIYLHPGLRVYRL